MRGSAARTWAALARSTAAIDPARNITTRALASAPAHRHEDASRLRRRRIDRHRGFATIGEASLVAAHAEVLRRAGAEIPPHLAQLLAVITAQGASPLPPDARDGLHPLVLPIAKVRRGDLDRVVGLLLRPSPSTRIDAPPLAGPDAAR